MEYQNILRKSSQEIEGLSDFLYYVNLKVEYKNLPSKKLYLLYLDHPYTQNDEINKFEYDINSKSKKAIYKHIAKLTYNKNYKYNIVNNVCLYRDLFELFNKSISTYDGTSANYFIDENSDYIYFEITDTHYNYKRIIGFMKY